MKFYILFGQDSFFSNNFYGGVFHTEVVNIDGHSCKSPSFRTLEEKLKQKLSIDNFGPGQQTHLFPVPAQYSITFKEESLEDSPVKGNKYNAVLSLDEKEVKVKIVTMRLDKKQHYFFLPQNTEITDFVNVPVTNDKTFHYSCRARAFNIVYEEGHKTGGAKLWLQLHVEEYGFEGVTIEDKSCNIYYNFKQVHKPHGESMGKASLDSMHKSLTTNQLWFWFDPNEEHPLKYDENAVVAWLAACRLGNVTDRILETPKYHYISASADIPVQAPEPAAMLLNNCNAVENEINQLITYFSATSLDKEAAVDIAYKRQAKFRKDVLQLCSFKCILTGVTIPEVLEVTHIFPVSDYKILQDIGLDIMDAHNGIALRSDVRRLFDAHLLEFVLQPDESNKVLLWLDPCVNYITGIFHGIEVKSFPSHSSLFLRHRLEMLIAK